MPVLPLIARSPPTRLYDRDMRSPRLAHYLRHPMALWHRVGRALYERRHPGEPWLSPRAIRFLEEEIRPTWNALEWGSGRSTTWFGARVGHLTSVEHDQRWYTIVQRRIGTAELTTVDLRLVPAEHPDHTPPERITTVPAYVAVADSFADGSIDLAIVDGIYRPLCVLAAVSKIRPGGLLLVDDTTWMPGLGTGPLAGWPLVCDGRQGAGSTMIWRRP